MKRPWRVPCVITDPTVWTSDPEFSCGCALEVTHLITMWSCCASYIDISGPTRAVKSFRITLKSLPRYTFLQNIYNSKLLFCIFWDIKNSYIKEVIYCSLSVWYTKMLYELTSLTSINTCRWMCVCKLYKTQKHASVFICRSFHSRLCFPCSMNEKGHEL